MAVTTADIAAAKARITAPGSFFEVGSTVIDGRCFDCYTQAPKTLIEVLQNSRGHGDQEFLVFEGRRYTFTSLFAEVDALAACLQQHYGIQQGDRVALAMRNNPEWVIAYLAITLVGAIVVPINSWGKTGELQFAIRDCGAALLICDRARWQLLAGVFAGLDLRAIVVQPDGGQPPEPGTSHYAEAIAQGRGREYQVAVAQPEDAALILYTSGSTGFPKGVLHRHIAITQSLMNMMFLGMLVAELEGGQRPFRGGAERETPMLTVPLFHGTGLLGGLLLPIMLGHKVVMMYKWDSLAALKLIEEEKVTGLATVPAILQDLLNQPQFDDYDTASLMRISAAGAATPAALPQLIAARVPSPSRSAGYAMTESMAVGSTMSGVIFDLKPESAGIISPIMKLRFVDPGGAEVVPGQPGEIEMQCICCTPGYWQKPEANAATFTADGWMKTGDLGLLDDDGFLHITGRIKEIVIRGGENIYPGEIEQVAFAREGVREVVVFGEPDAAMGEELVLVAHTAPGAALTEAELRDFLQQRLASYKVPRTIELWSDPLPRNASEKLHKLKVKEAYLAARERGE